MGISRDMFNATRLSDATAAPADAAAPSGSPQPQAGGAAEAHAAPALTPEMLARIAAVRSHIQLSVGQVVLAIMKLARYRHQSLGDLAQLVVEPLLRDRVAIAHRSVTGADGSAQVEQDTIAGIAIWATVSDAVDAKITEQARRGVGGAAAHQKQSAGTFPLRLAPEDWTSGDHVWLLDVMAEPSRKNSARLRRDVAADRKQTTAVLANFRQLAGAPDASVAERGFAATWASKGPSKRPVRIVPLVARLIDPDVLAKIRGLRGLEQATTKPWRR